MTLLVVNIKIGGVNIKFERLSLTQLVVNIEIEGVIVKIKWLSFDSISGKY